MIDNNTSIFDKENRFFLIVSIIEIAIPFIIYILAIN